MRIGTHSGTFHADEALACYILSSLTPAYRNAQIVRSRNTETLELCDIIVDVAGQYDGTRHFDHHQRGFSETFNPTFATKLSSAGLIYKHFGQPIIAQMLKVPETHENVTLLYNKLYSDVVEPIDANDNGISPFDVQEPPKFRYAALDLPAQVAHMNPWWNAPDHSDAELDRRFRTAMELMGSVFKERLEYFVHSWLPARDVVKAAFNASSSPIIVLSTYAPWKDHLYTLEQELGREITYVLYPEDSNDSSSKWRVQAVAVDATSFASRKALPEAWRGLRDEELSNVTKIPDCIFVHHAGFIGGNKTQQGALEMANISLKK